MADEAPATTATAIPATTKRRRSQPKKGKGMASKKGKGRGFFAKLRTFGKSKRRGAKSTGRRSASKRGGKRGAQTSGAMVLVSGGGMPPQLLIPTGKRKKKGGAMAGQRGKAGQRGVTTTEVLVDGFLVVAGTAGAVQIDKMVTVKPLGLNPSVITLGVTIGVAYAARRLKRPKVSRAAASIAVGLAAGIVGKTLIARTGGGSGGPTA